MQFSEQTLREFLNAFHLFLLVLVVDVIVLVVVIIIVVIVVPTCTCHYLCPQLTRLLGRYPLLINPLFSYRHLNPLRFFLLQLRQRSGLACIELRGFHIRGSPHAIHTINRGTNLLSSATTNHFRFLAFSSTCLVTYSAMDARRAILAFADKKFCSPPPT